jgi:hypothetical protein
MAGAAAMRAAAVCTGLVCGAVLSLRMADVAAAPQGAWAVDTSLHGLPLRTTVDSELAQYCLTDYLQGRRTRPEYDARLDAAQRRLAAGGPTRDTLLEIAQAASPDTATAFFADALLADARNHALRLHFEQALDAVQRGDAPLPAPLRQQVLILLAPGWLYVTQPETGADFARARRVLDAQGLRHELLRTHESGTIEENARIIADAILRRSDEYRALALTSTSKAGPEVGEALSLLEREQRRHTVRAWVNIGGILQGSPLADWAARWPQRGAVGLLAPFKGWTLASVDSMRTAPNRARAASWQLPRRLRVVNYLGVPFSGDITRGGRFGYRRILPQGPNDGLTLLPDAMVPGGETLVKLGLDHYYLDPRIDQKTAALAHLLLRELENTKAILEKAGAE